MFYKILEGPIGKSAVLTVALVSIYIAVGIFLLING